MKRFFSPKLYSLWFANCTGHQKALNHAEKLVGYPTTYSSLKYLAEEEPSNFLGLAKILVGSGHPLLTIARDLLSPGHDCVHQLGGLWVLLISKAAGMCPSFSDSDFVQGVHYKQRSLAEITELINTAFLIHDSVLDLSNPEYIENLNIKTLNLGNKLAVLGGDFLLAKASLELGKIENTQVVECMSKAIGHLSEGTSLETCNAKTWTQHVFLTKGSLLSNSCLSAVVMVDGSKELQEKAFAFGRTLALALQCSEDIKKFQSNSLDRGSYLSATAKGKIKKLLADNHPPTNLKEVILDQDPDFIRRAKMVCEAYTETCSQIIQSFPQKRTVDAVDAILKTIPHT